MSPRPPRKSRSYLRLCASPRFVYDPDCTRNTRASCQCQPRHGFALLQSDTGRQTKVHPFPVAASISGAHLGASRTTSCWYMCTCCWERQHCISAGNHIKRLNVDLSVRRKLQFCRQRWPLISISPGPRSSAPGLLSSAVLILRNSSMGAVFACRPLSFLV